jgi:predicted nuclease of restriction endonuclease-like (RecB) superfamily
MLFPKGERTMNELANSLIIEIKEVLKTARQNAAQQVNAELLTAYWNIGRIIVEHEQDSKTRAEYGTQTLKDLSKTLTAEFGKGFSVSNIQFMRRFYQSYQIQQTVSVKLSWSHYCELLSISDENKRGFYEKETLNSGWSVRELKRQISTSLYERLLLSDGKTNKETVLSLAQHGVEMSDPSDMIKDPYVFEFWRVSKVADTYFPIVAEFQHKYRLFNALGNKCVY